METLNSCFAIQGPQCVTLIGSGGKTSLMTYLAQNQGSLKVLVTTTTKMALPSPEGRYYDYFWDYPRIRRFPPRPFPGITLGGMPNLIGGKLESLPLEFLAELVPRFDRVFIEGDGSRNLPLKAWAAYEPVVPPCTTISLGVLPLRCLGMGVSESIIHRLPLFTALTAAQPGEPITLQHLVSVITGKGPAPGKGLFSAAQGRGILFFNQIEDPQALGYAEQLLSLLPSEFLAGLYRVIAGSVRDRKGLVLYRG